MWFFLEGWIWSAGAVFGIGVASDWLDGFLARKRGEVSAFGKFADPLVDKLLVTAVLLLFLERGLVGSVPVMFLLGREFVVMGLRSWGVARGEGFGANWGGKLKTGLQFGLVFYLLWLVVSGADGVWLRLVDPFVWLTVVVSVWSGGLYAWLLWIGRMKEDGARS